MILNFAQEICKFISDESLVIKVLFVITVAVKEPFESTCALLPFFRGSLLSLELLVSNL